MKPLHEELRFAVGCYRQVLEAFAALEGSIDQMPTAVMEARIKSLLESQQQARDADRALLASCPAGTPVPRDAQPLMTDYLDLLRQTAECNSTLLKRTRVQLALTAGELAELDTGQTVLRGYRQPNRSAGQRLSHSC